MKEKISYFKTYYLKTTFVVVFVIVCLIWILSDMFFNRANIVYSGAVFGCDISDEGKIFLTDDLLPYMTDNKPRRRDRAVISEDMHMLFAEGDEYNGQGTNSAVFTMLATGEFNYLILDEELIGQYLGMDACYDLTEMACEIDYPKENCYFLNNEILAFIMSDEMKEKCGVNSHSGKNVYLAFVNVENYKEKDIIFAKYLTGKCK